MYPNVITCVCSLPFPLRARDYLHFGILQPLLECTSISLFPVLMRTIRDLILDKAKIADL